MKIIRILPKFLQRKATLFALVSGLLTGAACWWLLPPEPRFSIKFPEVGGRSVFSPNLRYLALWSIEIDRSQTKPNGLTKFTSSDLTLWDIENDRCLGCFPIKGPVVPNGENFALAFTQDSKNLVEFSQGKALFRNVRNGNVISSNPPLIFPHYSGETQDFSHLVADENGTLMVLVKEKNNHWSVRDLVTGNTVNCFSTEPEEECSRWYRGDAPYSGIMVFRYHQAYKVRQVPTGKELYYLEGHFGFDTPWIYYWAITPDGKTRVKIDYQTYAWCNFDDKKTLKFAPKQWASASRDGRYLLLHLEPPNTSHWPAWLWQWLPKRDQSETDAVLYDLANESQVALFPNAHGYQFSIDGGRFVLASKDKLEIYDLPLPKPWLKIAAYSLGVSSSVFLIGLLLSFLRRKKAAPQLTI